MRRGVVMAVGTTSCVYFWRAILWLVSIRQKIVRNLAIRYFNRYICKATYQLLAFDTSQHGGRFGR